MSEYALQVAVNRGSGNLGQLVIGMESGVQKASRKPKDAYMHRSSTRMAALRNAIAIHVHALVHTG